MEKEDYEKLDERSLIGALCNRIGKLQTFETEEEIEQFVKEFFKQFDREAIIEFLSGK